MEQKKESEKNAFEQNGEIQKVTCIRCKKEVPEQDAVKTSKGVVCKSCVLKRKRRNKWIFASVIILLAIGAVVAYCLCREKKNNALGFEGVTTIQDSTNLVIEKPQEMFRLENAIAQSLPVVVGETIENIESFKRVLAENIQKAEGTNQGTVVIPNINLLFGFDSAVIEETFQQLLAEYAQAYLQTNRQAQVLVNGYACNIGSELANDRTSERRAEAVQEQLVALGVPANQIEIHWYGKSRNSEFSLPSLKDYRRVTVSIK